MGRRGYLLLPEVTPALSWLRQQRYGDDLTPHNVMWSGCWVECLWAARR